jgi:hypothetical protein
MLDAVIAVSVISPEELGVSTTLVRILRLGPQSVSPVVVPYDVAERRGAGPGAVVDHVADHWFEPRQDDWQQRRVDADLRRRDTGDQPAVLRGAGPAGDAGELLGGR